MAMEASASLTAVDQEEINPMKRRKGDEVEDVIKDEHEEEEEKLERLLLPDPNQLPAVPHLPSIAVLLTISLSTLGTKDSNLAIFGLPDFLKPGHDQYIYRHANGLCVVGLAPTHVALAEEGGITAVDFNTGNTDKSEMKIIGKRRRCCVKGSLLEVNDRLLKESALLNTVAAREGYVAILMPKPEDWLKSKIPT